MALDSEAVLQRRSSKPAAEEGVGWVHDFIEKAPPSQWRPTMIRWMPTTGVRTIFAPAGFSRALQKDSMVSDWDVIVRIHER
jgi:hypothetical protein